LEEVGWGAADRIVYADTNYTLFSLDRKTGKTREIGNELGAVGNGESVFSLSGNRRELAFTANCRCAVQKGTRVGVTSVTGGRVWWLSRGWPGRAEDPSFSPDGTRVAFETPSGIAVEPTHGGRIKMFPLAALCGRTAWSPNGRWIACVRAYSTLDLIHTTEPASSHPALALIELRVGAAGFEPVTFGLPRPIRASGGRLREVAEAL
jgi:hypothetical protein